MIAINDDYHENVTMADVERLIAGLS